MYHTLNFAVRRALDRLKEKEKETSAAVVDLYLFPNPETGDFTVYDDEDTELVSVSVPAWMEQGEGFDSEVALKECVPLLKNIVHKAYSDGLFDGVNMLKPFSVLLVDEEMEVIAELLTIDEEDLLLNDDFLKRVDEDLEVFYRHLMSGM